MSRNVCHGVIAGCVLAVPALLAACSPAPTPQDYSLVAQVAPVTGQGRIMVAVIAVTGGGCSVRVVTLMSTKVWTPTCRVTQDQEDYKSFRIDGQTVDMGEVNGSFKILAGTSLSIPVAAGTRSAAAGVGSAANGLAFPDTWNKQPYPGHLKLRGQNAGFMITEAMLTINGSLGMLNVTYKTAYSPLHLTCTVITDRNGDIKLTFDPAALVQIAGRGTYTVDLESEGQNITGDAWDASAFTTWQPAMPVRWVRVSD